MFGQRDAPVAESIVLGIRREPDERLSIHRLQLERNPGELAAAKRTVVVEELLLDVERCCDDTDEQLHEEHADEDDEDHRVEDHDRAIVELGLIVWLHGVDRAPQDAGPPLGRLDCQKREHAIQRRVEVETRLGPFATVAVAVPHSLDILVNLLLRKVQMLDVARVEPSGEDCRLKDGEEEDKEENDRLQADDAWDGATEGHNRNFEAFQA